jgi:hypothetical protein
MWSTYGFVPLTPGLHVAVDVPVPLPTDFADEDHARLEGLGVEVVSLREERVAVVGVEDPRARGGVPSEAVLAARQSTNGSVRAAICALRSEERRVGKECPM